MPDERRVLIVEDEDTIGEVVADALVLEGYRVRRARNGREALEMLQAWLPQLILLDCVCQPGMGSGALSVQPDR